MGDVQCNNTNVNETDVITIQKINEQRKMYALTKRISRFPTQIQEMIQKMFILKQVHICDRIVDLMNNSRKEEAGKLVKDLSGFDSQEFDELYFFSSVTVKEATKRSKLQKIDKKYVEPGRESLKKARIAFIVPVQCFWHLGVLAQTTLLSRKSKLELYLERIQAFCDCYHRNDDSIMTYLISHPSSLSELSRFASNKIRLISYEASFPCFNRQGKIALFGNNVEFHDTDGDLIHFMLANQTLSEIANKFDYVCFNNLHNLIGPVIEETYLGWLSTQMEKQILVTIKEPEEIIEKNNFLTISEDNQIGICLMKSSFLQKIYKKEKNTYQIFSSKIRQVRVAEDEDKFFFKRCPRDILYGPSSSVTGAKNWAENRVGYSEQCKRIMNISQENEQDIVEICPQILYGQPQKLARLRIKLEEGEGQIGYPMIVMKIQQSK